MRGDTVGVTGTQRGGSMLQLEEVSLYLATDEFSRFGVLRHGDCIGVDAEVHDIFRDRSEGGGYIIGHLPSEDRKRAFKECDETLAPLPYLERDRHIVENSSLMIALPGEMSEQLRSGTWATVRYARRLLRPILFIFPDGSSNLEDNSPDYLI